MAELRYPRFNTIYSSRNEAIKKLNELVRSYGEPVAIRYYNSTKEVCVILALYVSESKGDYSISYDSNKELNPSVYTSTKTSPSQTDEECIRIALFGKSPVPQDIVIITDQSGEEKSIRSYIYTTSDGWKLLSTGGGNNGSGGGEYHPDSVGSLLLGDSVTTGVDEEGNKTLEVKTDGSTIVYNEELGGLTVGTIYGGTF